MSSSSPTDFGTITTPLRSNCQETAPGSAIEPPLRENRTEPLTGPIAVVGEAFDDERDAEGA